MFFNFISSKSEVMTTNEKIKILKKLNLKKHKFTKTNKNLKNKN